MSIDFIVMEALGGLGVCTTGYNPYDRKTDAVVSALVAPENRDALVARLVESGVIAEAGVWDAPDDRMMEDATAEYEIAEKAFEEATTVWGDNGCPRSGETVDEREVAWQVRVEAKRRLADMAERRDSAVPLYRVNRGRL